MSFLNLHILLWRKYFPSCISVWVVIPFLELEKFSVCASSLQYNSLTISCLPVCLPCETVGSLGCVRALAGLVPSPNYKLPTFLLNFTDSARHGLQWGSLLAAAEGGYWWPEDASRKFSRQTIYWEPFAWGRTLHFRIIDVWSWFSWGEVGWGIGSMFKNQLIFTDAFHPCFI